MNLVQMRHPGSLKAYVREFNTQMNGTTKMDEFAKKCIVLGGVSKGVVNTLFKFPKFIEVVAGIIKIAKSIEVDDPEKKLGGASPQMAQGKEVPRK